MGTGVTRVAHAFGQRASHQGAGEMRGQEGAIAANAAHHSRNGKASNDEEAVDELQRIFDELVDEAGTFDINAFCNEILDDEVAQCDAEKGWPAECGKNDGAFEQVEGAVAASGGDQQVLSPGDYIYSPVDSDASQQSAQHQMQVQSQCYQSTSALTLDDSCSTIFYDGNQNQVQCQQQSQGATCLEDQSQSQVQDPEFDADAWQCPTENILQTEDQDYFSMYMLEA